ncbi:MAG: DUF7007 domain-containing protein [Gemmatimonadaceae bacterium]
MRRFHSASSAIRTPWGMSQTEEPHGDGITFYSTPLHGGFKVEGEAMKLMPAALRISTGFFEEDCEAALVIVAFPDRFTAEQVESATRSVKDWFPERYTKWTGKALELAESFKLRRRVFEERTADSYVARAAWGDWHQDVPTAMVGVLAFCRSTNAEAGFLVPKEEYSPRGEFSFVVDHGPHQPWIVPSQTKEVHFLPVPERPLTKDLATAGRSVRYFDTVYRLVGPVKKSWIVKREPDRQVFRLGPTHLKHCTIPDDNAEQGAAA